jgi:hypothetical protein
MNEKNQPYPEESKGELLVYRTEDGQVKLEVRLQDETVWRTQQMMAELFQSLGLKYALDPQETEPHKLRNIYRAMDSEFFRKAKILVSAFIEKFEYLECSRITARKFNDWGEFSKFRNTSSCDAINKFLINETVEIINL